MTCEQWYRGVATIVYGFIVILLEILENNGKKNIRKRKIELPEYQVIKRRKVDPDAQVQLEDKSYKELQEIIDK